MLFYNFAETSLCEAADVGKYAPIAKLMFKDRTYHISNAFVTFTSIGGDVAPLKVRIFSPATPSGEIYLVRLNHSAIDCFIIANEGDQYATLYVKGATSGGIIVMTIDSAINANMFTPIWGGKYETSVESATFTPTDSPRISGVFTKYTQGVTSENGNIVGGGYDGHVLNVYADGYLVIPFKPDNSPSVYFKVLNYDMTPAVNVDVTLTINYWSE